MLAQKTVICVDSAEHGDEVRRKGSTGPQTVQHAATNAVDYTAANVKLLSPGPSRQNLNPSTNRSNIKEVETLSAGDLGSLCILTLPIILHQVGPSLMRTD